MNLIRAGRYVLDTTHVVAVERVFDRERGGNSEVKFYLASGAVLTLQWGYEASALYGEVWKVARNVFPLADDATDASYEKEREEEKKRWANYGREDHDAT